MSLKAKLIGLLAMAGLPNLSDNTADDDFVKHIQDLVDKANKVPTLQKDLADSDTAKRKAETDLADYKAAENVKRIEATTLEGINKGKLTAAVAKDLSDKFANDPEAYQRVVDGLPVYKTVAERLANSQSGLKDLADMSWQELDQKGKLQDLKDADLDCFKSKFKAEFNTDYKG